MIRRSALLATTLAALSFAAQANADYTVTPSGLTPPSYTGSGSPGTQLTFTIPTTPGGSTSQPGLDGGTSSFNVINVAEPTGSFNSMGSVFVSETLTFAGTNGNTSNMVGTLSGTFTITGMTTSFSGSFATTSGSGFAISNISYAPPSPTSTNGSSNSGNVSLFVTPNAVPEPASVAMLGMGLVGVGVTAYRRRRAK